MTTQPTVSRQPAAADPPAAEDVPCAVGDRRQLRAGFRIDHTFYDRYGAPLGPYGLAVYTAQLRLANQPAAGEASPARIAKLIGLSPQRVRRELKKLKHLGLLARETNHAQEGSEEEVR